MATKATTKKTKATASAEAKTPKEKKPVSDVFAVIQTGGKQYKVSEGLRLKIEKISDDLKEGDKVVFDKVLLMDDGKGTTVGTPHISSSKVEGVIKKVGRSPKVVVIQYKQKSRYFKKRGHRQPFFEVEIVAVK